VFIDVLAKLWRNENVMQQLLTHSYPTNPLYYRTLRLTGNKLDGLSESVGDCVTLESIDLSGNNINAANLPSAMWRLPKLTTVDLTANPPTAQQGSAALDANIPEGIRIIL
jgi:hypothetical protein